MKKMKIRKAGISDAYGIAKVQVDTWRSAYKGIISDNHLQNLSIIESERRWKERLEKIEKERFFYVAEDEVGNILGFALGGLEQFEPDREDSLTSQYEGELMAIYVLKDNQRVGIGTQLVQKVVQNLLEYGVSSMLVWILKKNIYRAFYEKLGGKYLNEKDRVIGGINYRVVSYGWDNIKKIQDNELLKT